MSGKSGEDGRGTPTLLTHVGEDGTLAVGSPDTPIHIYGCTTEIPGVSLVQESDPSEGEDSGPEDDHLAADGNLAEPLKDHFQNEHVSPGAPRPLQSRTASRMERDTVHQSSNSLHNSLFRMPHLCTLSNEEIRSLTLKIRQYAPLDLVFSTGHHPQDVYVLSKGCVEVFNSRGKSLIGHKRVGTIRAPNIFALDSAIFDRPAQYTFRAGANADEQGRSYPTDIVLIPKKEFLRLLASNPTFAMSVGHKVVDHIEVFSVFQEFCRSIFAKSSVVDKQEMVDGYTLNIPVILESYMKIDTSIHSGRQSPDLDLAAWSYALNRLPQNITETFVLNLVRSIPPFIANELRASLEEERDVDPNSSFANTRAASTVEFVPTKSRRRCTWKIGDRGNTIVLLREGFTDVIDLVTCFCIHLVEARKYRQRLQTIVAPSAVEILMQALSKITDDSSVDQLREAEIYALDRLPLSVEEKEGLLRMWPRSFLRKTLNILMHREEIVVKIDTSISKRFDDDPYLRWAISLRQYVCPDGADPEDVTIDILSSNTHTTKNLLCSYAVAYKDEINAWVKANEPKLMEQKWSQDQDMLYYAFGLMLNRDDTLRAKYRKTLQQSGFVIMEETSMTGLQVDIIDVRKLAGELIDEKLEDAFRHSRGEHAAGKRHFILNMNFAFGAQADGISRALMLTFGRQIRSINVVGKAAGLQGKRGDLQVPTKLIFSKAALGEDSTDEIYDVNVDENMKSLAMAMGAKLQSTVPDRGIHVGSVMTSPGTLLNNATVFKYYQTIFGCVGVEMEGSYFARQVADSINLGLVRSSIKTRYIYYTHDLPASPRHQYKPLEAIEGVPPLYAAVRVMLEQMLSLDDKEPDSRSSSPNSKEKDWI